MVIRCAHGSGIGRVRHDAGRAAVPRRLFAPEVDAAATEDAAPFEDPAPFGDAPPVGDAAAFEDEDADAAAPEDPDAAAFGDTAGDVSRDSAAFPLVFRSDPVIPDGAPPVASTAIAPYPRLVTSPARVPTTPARRWCQESRQYGGIFLR